MKHVTSLLRWPLCLLTLLGFLSSYSGALADPLRKPGFLAGPTPPGNYVFQDDNQNNIFDAAEVGIPNIRINLYTSDGVLRETTLTTSTGLFSFTSTIQPSTSYDIRISGADAPANRKLVVANQGSDEFADSDAVLVGSTAVIVVQSSAAGTLTNNFGFGYVAGDPDLVLTNVSNSFTVAKGTTATSTITINNVGGSTATGVVLRDTLDQGVQYVSSSPSGTTALLGSGQVQVTWSVGTIPASTTVGYSVTVRAIGDGVLSNVAGVTATSADGTPRNNVASSCSTVPVKLCQGDTYVTSLSANLTNVEWFRDGVSVGTGNSLTIVTAGTYSYTSATAGSNCQASSCCPIIIYNGTVPDIAITPSTTAICAGESVLLTATGCVGSLRWDDGSTTSSITVSPTATTSYSVTCTPDAADGCPATATATVTVNPSVTATLSSATICDGTSATLIATGGTSYTFSDGTINTTGTLIVSPTSTTAYSVTVANSSGCTGVASGTVTVNPAVTATVASATICDGTSTTLTADASGGGGFSYAWSPAGTGSTRSVSVSPNTTTTYTVVVTNSDGCSTTATATVTVNPSVTATLSSATICDGTSATLIATGGTSYTFSDGTINTTGTLVISPASTTVYSVTVANSSGCTGTASGTVTVNPAVTATVASATICDGTSTTLTANASGGSGFSYAWSPAGTGSTRSVSVSPNTTTTYTVVVTNSDGCSTTATATVTVNPAITATIGVTPSQTICEGTSVTLTATGTGGTAYSYLWSTTATTRAITVAPNTTTTYSVTVTDTETGCETVTTTTILVNPTPVLSVNSPTICQESTAILSLTGCSGSVIWSTGTVGNTLTVTPLQTTSYTAVCTLSTGCSATIATTVTVTPAPAVQPQNVLVTRATCTGANANSDASIALTGLQNTVRVSISAADGTTVPDFASASVVTGNAFTFSNLPNPTQRVTYLISLYGADGTCSTRVTVTLEPADCVCPVPACVPIVIRKIR